MNSYVYEISNNNSLNRWWLTEVKKEPFLSPTKAFDADVNLGEGYVQIIYPVREAFLNNLQIDEVERNTEDYTTLYFPFENNKVEFSDFIFTPHILSCYGSTSIIVDEDSIEAFTLATCGGVKLWLNGKEVLKFTPYTRNTNAVTDFDLHFKKGENLLEIYFDELAERDVFYYFDFRYRGKNCLKGKVNINENPETIKKFEALLSSCYFTKDLYESGEVELGYNPKYIESSQNLRITSQAFRENSNQIFTIKNTDKKIVIKKVDGLNQGLFKYHLSLDFEQFSITRTLLTCQYQKELKYRETPETIEERKRVALDFTKNYGEDNVNKAIAIMVNNKAFTPEAKKAYENSLDYVLEKRDCADFYLPNLIRTLQKYSDFLSIEEIQRLEEAIVNFRYWIDEPGNDVMWYFSENHAFLFHTNQYLAGYLLQKRVFTVSCREGIDQYELGKERLIKWFKVFLEYGYAEWNSVTYIPIDLIGLFALYDLAPDKEIRDYAKEGLDFTFKILAYNNFHGILSSSYGRTYEHSLKGRELAETSFMEWISSGKGFMNFSNRALTAYCLSDYVPPSEFYKETEIAEDEGLELTLLQGINKTKLYSYKTNHYCMSSAINFHPFNKGHQQHIQNISLSKKNIQLYINHPGERPFSGENRPSYWAGNGRLPLVYQYKGVQFIQYKLKEEDLVHYIHVYSTFYDYDSYEIDKHWFTGCINDSYIAICFSEIPYMVKEGANTNKEIIALGLEHSVIVRVGSKQEFENFDNFVKVVKKATCSLEKDSIVFNDPIYGKVSLDSDKIFCIHDQEHQYKMSSAYTVIKTKTGVMQ